MVRDMSHDDLVSKMIRKKEIESETEKETKTDRDRYRQKNPEL
jgi:hypothetical protein